ncbi:MAG: type II toxin-antitoxin system HipA family toxin, partial [Rhodomicrobium sp.]
SPGNGRIHYISLLTALNAVDHDDSRSYLEIVDALRQFGSEPEKDIRQMWRRMVFNVLVSNTDDHVRNHGFLINSEGWRLAPAFDMNPCPADIGGRIHKLALNEDENSGSLDLAMSVAPYFGLKKAEAAAIAAEVGVAVSKWRKVAAAHKIEKHEIERLQSAFDHQDLKNAISLRVAVPAPKDVKTPATKRKASEKAARKRA